MVFACLGNSGVLAGLAGGSSEASSPIASGRAQDGIPLGFSHATPDAVGLADAESVAATSFDDRAGVADGFSALFAHCPCATTLAIWMKENGRICAAAGTFQLPLPEGRCGSWKLVWLWHVDLFSSHCCAT